MSNPIGEKRLLDITGADDLEQIRQAREKEQNRMTSELATSPIESVVVELNELHDALIARTLKLVENDLARMGLGAPPVPYTYMLYGSAGRFEQTMSSDQDSGLVYADADNEADEQRNQHYFAQFAELVVQQLIVLGYPPCEGNVISSNPEWCQSLKGWEKRIDNWFSEPSWENVRYLLIAADGRPVYGSMELAGKLRDRFFNDMLSNPVISQRMMENTLRHKVLVGVFGQLLTERYGEDAGSLDIKYGAYIPMVNAFRLLAVQAGISKTSTLERIEALQSENLLTTEEASLAKEAFVFFLKLRMLTTVSNEEGQLVGTGKLSADQLTKDMTVQLKKALKEGRKIQVRVQKELQRRFGGR
jgi:CBS domain-containing protein